MAIRGIAGLFILPFAMVFIIGACWMAASAGYGEMIMAEPDQLVQTFMRDVLAGDINAARTHLGAKVAHTDLNALRWGILERYGDPVTTMVQIRRESARRAIMWTYTATAPGNRYFIRWVVVFEHGHWVINDLQGIRALTMDT